jgi:AcrR family transcriptional regulator
MSDPLLDTLFRPTSLSPRLASAAPVRAAGTHTRAGNAMNRTRAALLDGARRAVQQSGTKITMAQVAAAAGVAKATLYNHFRTRDAVLAALVEDEVVRLAAGAAGLPPERALAQVAEAIVTNPMIRALAAKEPGTLSRLARVDPTARGWKLAEQAVIGGVGAPGTRLVLRWLSSYLTTPASTGEIAAEAEIVSAGLTTRVHPEQPAADARSA